MVIQIFQMLVYSACLHVKCAPWGFRVAVFISPMNPATCPGEMPSGVPSGSGTEFDVGRSSSEEEVFGATRGAPM